MQGEGLGAEVSRCASMAARFRKLRRNEDVRGLSPKAIKSVRDAAIEITASLFVSFEWRFIERGARMKKGREKKTEIKLELNFYARDGAQVWR